MKYALTTEVGTDFVVGKWAGSGGGVPVSQDPTRLIRACSLDQYEQVSAGLRHQAGDLRWTFDGTTVTEVPDARPILRFTPNTVEVDVGDPSPNVLIEVVDENGNLRPSVNGERRIPVGERRFRVVFTAGSTTIAIPTTRARHVEITTNKVIRVVAPLIVDIDDNEL